MLLLFIIIAILLAKGPKDKRRSDVAKLLIFVMTISSIISSFAFSSTPNIGFAVLGLLGVGIYKYIKKKNKEEQEARYNFEGEAYKSTDKTYEQAHQYYAGVSLGKIPGTQKGRKRLIQQFNEKYDLFLTEEQIDSIVSSTYLSEIWKKEVADMSLKYETVHQWFVGPTAWLRLYIHAFIPQEITSDFAQQEKIAIYSFDEVFTYAEELGKIPLADKIDRVNNKFFAQFDDITFMAAFRYLESKGIKHNLEVASPINSNSKMDDLIKKYEEAGAEA